MYKENNMNPKIEWTTHGMWTSGKALSASGKQVFITEAATKKGKYFAVYVEGDTKKAATRATLQEVYRIINTR